MMRSTYLILLVLSINILTSCGKREVVVVMDRYPDNSLKLYKRSVSWRKKFKNTEQLRTKKRYKEYYANGNLKLKEHSKDKFKIWQMSEDPIKKVITSHYNENGNITNKMKKYEDDATIWEYRDGKLVSKKYISGGKVKQMEKTTN